MLLNPLFIIMLCFSLLGALCLVGLIRSLKRSSLLRGFRNAAGTLFCFFMTILSGMLIIANHGYRALVKEELAATITVQPMENKQFIAHITFPDSTTVSYTLAGDQVYIDAHILKWHPLLNRLGVHTTYELDRLGGRYISIDDENTKPHTVFPLSKRGPWNMFNLRRRWKVLKPFLDAEYGSATFARSDRSVTYHIMVTTSGLIMRERNGKSEG